MPVARPDSDVSAGSWTTAPLWQKIDEVVPDDASTQISAPFATDTTCEIGLSDLVDPGASGGHVLRVRHRTTSAFEGWTFQLWQGGSQIFSAGITSDTTYATSEFTLSGAQADSITDYADLRLKFISLGSAVFVTWAEFEVPTSAGGGLQEERRVYPITPLSNLGRWAAGLRWRSEWSVASRRRCASSPGRIARRSRARTGRTSCSVISTGLGSGPCSFSSIDG